MEIAATINNLQVTLSAEDLAVSLWDNGNILLDMMISALI